MLVYEFHHVFEVYKGLSSSKMDVSAFVLMVGKENFQGLWVDHFR